MIPKGLRKYVVAAAILFAVAIWAVFNGHYLLAFFEAWLAVGMFGRYAAYFDENGAMGRRSLRVLIVSVSVLVILAFGGIVTDKIVGLDAHMHEYITIALLSIAVVAFLIAPLSLQLGVLHAAFMRARRERQ